MAGLFTAVIYQPIYNALALILSVLPGSDVGIGIIVLTVLVRLVLFPLSWSAITTQMTMRELDPQLKALREKHKDNQELLAKETMALFKERKVNPFASFFLILVQLPIIIGLYTVLRTESHGIAFDPALLYSFIHAPSAPSTLFLGLVDLAGKSIVLAILVALTQFAFARLMTPPKPKTTSEGAPSFQEDLQKSMGMQMLYIFPLVLGGIAYATSAAIALYFIVSNTFSIGQELVVRKLHAKR
jgi:YidC/Oxa1 family membrane protein insertase